VVIDMNTSESDRKSANTLVVIAIGGNSLIKDREHMSVLDQYRAAGETSRNIEQVVISRRS